MTCSWPVDRECLSPVEEGDLAGQAARDAAEDLAVQVLYNLSGRQFGVCPVIARPCPSECSGVTGGWWLTAYLYNGEWRNSPCGCSSSCSRSGPSAVHLPGPVQSITAVTINGVILDESEYRREGDLLYRVGGVWPSQNLQQPLDEPGTWSVEYERGTPPPAGVGVLVGKLAAEFLSACQGGKCKLPVTVRTITRNGVTYQTADPGAIYDKGYTGITEIDLWLSATNPHKVMRRPKAR